MIVFATKIGADLLFGSLVATQANLLYPLESRRSGCGDSLATGVREAKTVDFLCT